MDRKIRIDEHTSTVINQALESSISGFVMPSDLGKFLLPKYRAHHKLIPSEMMANMLWQMVASEMEYQKLREGKPFVETGQSYLDVALKALRSAPYGIPKESSVDPLAESKRVLARRIKALAGCPDGTDIREMKGELESRLAKVKEAMKPAK